MCTERRCRDSRIVVLETSAPGLCLSPEVVARKVQEGVEGTLDVMMLDSRVFFCGLRQNRGSDNKAEPHRFWRPWTSQKKCRCVVSLALL